MNQIDGDSVWGKRKKYDIFISFRCYKGDEPVGRFLARSLKQTFETEGYSVYFSDDDCGSGDYINALKSSRYIVVLLTEYSFDKKAKGGESFRREMEAIRQGFETGALQKERVRWVNVDNRYHFSNEVDELEEFVNSNNRINVYTSKGFQTDLKKIVYDDKGRRIIRKFPRFSYKLCRVLSGVLAALSVVLVVVLATTLCRLWYYSRPPEIIPEIIMVGGSSVKNCIDKTADLSGLNIHYLPLPSQDAWPILWDEKNREHGHGKDCYTVVLSAMQITDSILYSICDSADWEKKGRKLVEYIVGDSPLVVQVDAVDTTPISIDDLRRIFCDTTNYIVGTTSPTSGTYYAYFEEYNVDSCQRDDMFTFTQDREDRNGFPKNKKRLYLANSEFYREGYACKPVVGASLKLYLYVACENNELPKPVRMLIEKLGGDVPDLSMVQGTIVTVTHR